ncbi:MAG: bifunctional phosphopantothenoylcysteine decarboxylase/phosphopantothenate--cysteine ligase CoaBC [Paludibacteraceae bacterium]|nr:bifunctional phosphopantothenoylcysteine decarboxylase/phosphopantothenate--cysteine ligase CoaBC [Paludibacteraceae bacterium]
MLKGKKILLGISGGIAAYKTPELARLLMKQGADVKVVVTKNALQFVTAFTLETLTHHKVYVDMFEGPAEYHTEHISLAQWANCLLVAPATANVMAKMANGIADDALSTTNLACKCPVMVVPAMNENMWDHPATQHNVQVLTSRGVEVLMPAEGELACGVTGKGRMPEPDVIVMKLVEMLTPKTLKGKKVLLTAGPTYERIDPVRFIGNFSTGKMGCALAEVCMRRGAEVTLVAGPMQQVTSVAIRRIDVMSAAEMFEATIREFPQQDVAILSAAVADFTPEYMADVKIKREKDDLTFTLKPTHDIAATLGTMKQENQKLVGFALETNQERENAERKLTKKNLDFIVLNSLNDKGAGFGYDTNKITILDKTGQCDFPLKSKQQVAEDIINHLENLL